jgi:hypothetical protein
MLDVVDVDLAARRWRSVVHGNRERLFRVHGDLGRVPVAVPDPMGLLAGRRAGRIDARSGSGPSVV